MDEPLTLNKKKQKKTGQYSIVTFDLFKPKGNKYPNFDFAKVQKKLGCADSDDDERFHDSDAREIVRRLEAKYPNKKTKSGKKVKYNEDDFIQKSLGYDMEDEFIDDSEAHDELVPSTLDTKKGGFYVNKGVLEFVSIGEEGSDDDSGEEDERPKRKKKEEEKAPMRSPKRPDQVKADQVKKADDAKRTAHESKKTLDNNSKKRSAISSSSSSSDSESEKEEGRRVGGPPTLKRSKPSLATAVPSASSSSPAQLKKPDEKASEPRRMAGAPPNLLRKKTEPVPRPSLAGRPPITSSHVKTAAEIPIETISSEESDEPSNTNGSGPRPGPSDHMEVDINEVPHPVQLKIVAFEALCQKYQRPGRKHVSDAVIDGAIEINELTNRLGMKKGLKSVVMEKLAQMCGYSRAGLEQRIKNSLANRTTAPVSAPTLAATTVSTSTASSSTTTPISQPVQQQKAAPSYSSESITSFSSTSSESVVSVVAGPSKPNPAVVIGVKPPTAAAAAAAAVPRTGEGKSEPEKMIGRWTVSQVQEALKKIPEDREMVEVCAMQMSYEDFVKITTNPDPNNSQLIASLLDNKQFFSKFVVYKQSLMRKYPLLGEKAILHMDITEDAEICKFFILFLEVGKHFGKSPLYYLAYLDDMMKHFCGTYGRTDRLIRHFLKNPTYKESLDRVRMLPEFTKMGQQFAEWESAASKMSHQMPSVKTAAANGKPAAAAASSGSKPVLKQTQITALLTSLPGTSTQDSALQNMVTHLSYSLFFVDRLIMQMLQAAAQEERAKKAKEEEERRILIAKAKAEEAEKKRKEKEEAAALKKAQKEEEKRLEKERKQKEAEEERKRKEEEKNKRIEEERQRRIREEEEKERRRKEEIERKLKEEAERKRREEEVARQREELRIKQEEERREREKKEMEEQLREEEERAALMLADEVTMEMEEMEGVPRPLTEIEEVEVAEEEEMKRERERQVIAARELAMQRQNSMVMSAGLGSVKPENHENPDKELLDSFFMGGSGDVSSQSSTTATVSGPVSSRETTNTASASSSSSTLHSFSDMKLAHGPMSMQTMMVQSPHIPAARFQNGSQYVQPSNPNTPAAFVNSPFPSAAHAQSPLAMPSRSSPMMNASPSNSQMLSVCKNETSIAPPSGSATPTSGGHRHNSL
ncbi:hypothetical protein PRIPAC_94106 [Pristionchus pacificus]|uniref:HUN domain-containing protein n=1 Tax=Pristionchus pacificus TaxID=54126 RepID=A0A2A6BAR4_PRIPA|nr:hypothetical protein PRIPAC_94106 [Pristionchus pacificus]|eukprot:PDM62972.1 hypothetical protein PRIPAC_50187 [Pristionchus pacificus]